MKYNYSPLLKEPAKMPELDPQKPAMAPMLRIMLKTQQKQTEAFVPREGCMLHQTDMTSGDGTGFKVWTAEPEEGSGTLPGMMLVHGGAFYLPAAVSALALACEYAVRLNIRVFVPEYRLLPASPAPSAFEDCLACWEQMCALNGLDHERLLIMGESAGGALAAGISAYLRDHDMRKPCGQLLIYPVLDDRQDRYPSVRQYEDAVWSPKANRLMWAAYLKNCTEDQLKYMVPLRAEDFSDMPGTYVEPQEFDILRDEGIAYAEELKKAGSPVTVNEISGSYHGFDADLTSPLVQEVIETRVSHAKRMLNCSETI